MNSLLILLICVAATSANEAAEEFSKSNNQFASSVYQKISKGDDGNFLLSPFSTETILALLHAGSRGQTAKELGAALHLSNDSKKVEEGVKFHLSNLERSEDYDYELAVKMYVKNTYNVKPEFKKLARDIFHFDFETINFTRNVKAAKVINGWVEKKTRNRIHNLINSDLLDADTRLVFINTLYFKANWSAPFHLGHTSKETFYKTPTQTVEVDSMHSVQGRHFLFSECDQLKAKFLELPFEGAKASMTFVLPNEKDGLARLESQMDKVLEHHNVVSQAVKVVLPKFKIESKVNLKQILIKLGVNTIFQNSAADLSGIAGKRGDLVLSEILHKSMISVNEEGVEAADAIFTIDAARKSGFNGQPAEFIADHPFIFYIRFKRQIILVGRVRDPTS